MSNRTPFVGGNWKMNTNLRSARELAGGVVKQLGGIVGTGGVETAVFVPFPYLLPVAGVFGETGTGHISLGAQDLCEKPDGAMTGEVSVAMLKDCGASVVLAGHSERRHVIGESDELVNAKTLAALEGGLDVILCIGETLDQREAGQTDAVNERQLRAGLAGVSPEQMSRVTIAYEPVWAIGTGKTATPADAQDAHAKVRAVLAGLYTDGVAQATRIQYGGSMKPSNAAELLAQPDIDGGLIGGASLKPDDFAAIVRAASATHANA